MAKVEYINIAGDLNEAAEVALKASNYNTVVGELLEVSTSSEPYVLIAGTSKPLLARSALPFGCISDLSELPVKVTLIFENGNPELPVITGIVRDTLVPESKQENNLSKTRVQVDGKYISFDAQNEILLRCGKSSILLRRDGKIVIKGASVTSRSSGSNKIKGSSVSIN